MLISLLFDFLVGPGWCLSSSPAAVSLISKEKRTSHPIYSAGMESRDGDSGSSKLRMTIERVPRATRLCLYVIILP